MRLLRPTKQKLKVTLCHGFILFFVSACEIKEQLDSLAGDPGAQLARIGDGPLSPEKIRENLARSNILGSNPSELGCLICGGMIQCETQFQKAETYQDENKSVLPADSRTVHSLKESKAELRWAQCKEQENRYIEVFFEHHFVKQIHWDAK